MILLLLSEEKELAVAGQDVVRLFYPDAAIYTEPASDCDMVLKVSASGMGESLEGRVVLSLKDGQSFSEDTRIEKIPLPGDERNHRKRLVKLALFRLLSRFTNKPPGPWGILTGIRPAKIVHRLLDVGWKQNDIIDYLISQYDMSYDRANLLNEIALRQRTFLLTPEESVQKLSIYIGIPFCPTRCAYCSFPASSLEKSGHLLQPFLDALNREIERVGGFLKQRGKTVQTIYLGGGTPTVLDSRKLSRLLEFTRDYLVSDETREITLEAGRPDTVTEEKLRTAHKYGVTRLSINPQSMNGETLKAIGRCHTPGDVTASFKLARRIGFDNINMDIILGLPGETGENVRHTLDAIFGMRPENLTVHTLAVKRASHIKESRETYSLPEGQTVSQMLKLTAKAAQEMGMVPYYLYRQKKMVGPYENIGYARPGYECIYNIQIIEERQTIIGLGGGSGSKFVEPGTWYLTSHYNPKDPETYVNRIEEIIERKISILDEYFNRFDTDT